MTRFTRWPIVNGDYMKKNTLYVIALLLVSLAIFVLPNLGRLKPLTVISPPSSVYIEPIGRELDGEWTGSYWSMQVAVTSSDEIAGFKALEVNQSEKVTVDGEEYDLRSGANIEIRIDPQPPYFARKIRDSSVEIVPKTYGAWYNPLGQKGKLGDDYVNPLWSGHFDWAESGWRWYTPYTITVLKNGEVIATKPLNAEGEDRIQTIETSEGTIRIEHLGSLLGEYRTIEVPEQIVIFDKSYVYDWSDRVDELLPYDQGAIYLSAGSGMDYLQEYSSEAYSVYWYGNDYKGCRWSDNHSPAPFYYKAWGTYQAYGDTKAGWREEKAVTTWVYPIRPVVFPHDKSELPSEKRSFMSVVEYLESKGATNLANTIFAKFENWEIEGDQVKVYIPWNAYGTPLVHFLIPTELADTWVYRPSVSNVIIANAEWFLTGTKDTDLYGSQQITVSLRQDSSVKSSCEIKVTPSTAHVSVYPLSKTLTLEPNEVMQTHFDITNLGVESETKGTLTIEVYETWSMTLTSKDTSLTYTLKPKTEDKAILDLLVVDRQTQKPVVGIHVFVQYGVENTKEGFSNSHGKVGPFDLGNYRGTVQISTGETATYKPAYRTVNVAGGYNSFTIELLKHGEEPEPEPFPWWLLFVSGIILVSLTAVAYVYFKRKGRKRR